MMEKEHKDILRKNRTDLMDNIADVTGIINKLYQRKLLPESLKTEVEAKVTSDEKIGMILDILPKKGAKAFDSFYECLMETEDCGAAYILKPELRPTDLQHEGTVYLELAEQKAEDEYQQTKEEIRKDLITLYRKKYSTLHLPGLFKTDEVPLLGFYVMPDIKKVEIQKTFGGNKEIKSTLTTLRDVFYKENIYLVADAGLGKTAFSQRLVLTWCQAKGHIEDETKYFVHTEIDALSEFELVFLLYLRGCSDECDIDNMIRAQLCSQLANTPTNVETVLSKENCLVILDGLDEWKHPKRKCTHTQKDIPHSKARNKCTILTTAKPWRWSEREKLELWGLNEKSQDILKKNVISQYIDVGATEEEVREKIREFDSEVAEKGISDMETTPLLLLYLLCLWCDKIHLGRSKCEIYCQIVELLLKRRLKKRPLYRKGRDIPSCFAAKECEFCRYYFTFLTSLGELAFQTLFSETNENRLVFDSSIAEECLKKEGEDSSIAAKRLQKEVEDSSIAEKFLKKEKKETYLDLGLQTGLITQTTQKTVDSQTSETSFSHKTVQEFFAALYISTCSDEKKEEVQTKVLKFCKSTHDILELSKVFIFLSGIDAELLSSLSHKLMEVINKDEITSKYRSTAEEGEMGHPLREIQDMFVSCIKEIPDNKHISFCLQDFFFGKEYEQENYFTSLQRLAVNNKTNITSIHINYWVGQNVSEIIDSYELSDPEIHCQKISSQRECKEEDIIRLLSTSGKCFRLANILTDDESKDVRSCFLTDEKCNTFHNSSQLETIDISASCVSHKFLNCIINVKSIKQITLEGVECSEHGDPCPGFNFDLSHYSELRKLVLISYCVFTLCDMNEDESLLSHNLRNIEHVWLSNVKMSSLLLRRLVEIIEKLEHSVRVCLAGLIIKPREEFVKIRKYICGSDHFVVYKDERNNRIDEVETDCLSDSFEFVTKK